MGYHVSVRVRLRGSVPPDASEGRAERPDVGAWDQAWRLSADGPVDAWWRARPSPYRVALYSHSDIECW